MYCERTHFISKMLVAVLAWATSALLRAGSVDVRSFQWYLRPHHEAADFQSLLKLAREAFNACAAGHVACCKLWGKMPLVVVDGKWSIQTPLCAERGSGPVWNTSLGTGFLQGCQARPLKGQKFCSLRQPQCTLPPESCVITAHREIKSTSGVALQYSVDGVWKSAAEVAVGQVRAYELLACKSISAES